MISMVGLLKESIFFSGLFWRDLCSVSFGCGVLYKSRLALLYALVFMYCAVRLCGVV